MNLFLQQGVVGTGHVVRTMAIVSVDLTRQLEQFARSALTGVVVIGSGHLLGNSAYRELWNEDALPGILASALSAPEPAVLAQVPYSFPVNAA